jgi:outer membrane protein OmpA-like peptidoglycan-associated protein
LALVFCLVSAPAPAAEGAKMDFNAIVRGLAPIQTLPEHGGKAGAPRSIDLEIRFAVNSDKLSEQATRQLDELAKALKHPSLAGLRFRIAGHTDALGRASYNKALSLRRAKAVKRYMVEKTGIDDARLESEGWGEARLKDPLNPNASVNRRVQVISLGPEAKPAKPFKW